MAEQDSTPTTLYRTATQAALLGLVVNLALGIVKLVGGIVGSSFALISDAINSLGDSLTSVVVLGALWYAQRPADEEHPYGHTRAEAVAASNVALLDPQADAELTQRIRQTAAEVPGVRLVEKLWVRKWLH